MGVVWRATDELLGRDVAVKEVRLNPALGDAERVNAYKRTLREARTAARLSHRGVVTIFDVVEEDGRPWIIMELVRSRSLDEILGTQGRLPPRRAARVAQQLLSALAHAHAAGVLHRDVKPSNVLLASGGYDERAVLTDFGIAQFTGDPRLTQTGMVMGSPGFTAPERIRGGSATPASDLWSLGATIFAACEGKGPYEHRGSAITTMSAIINEDAPPATAAGQLGPVIAALLRRDPARRPSASSAASLIDNLLPKLPDAPAARPRTPTTLSPISRGTPPAPAPDVARTGIDPPQPEPAAADVPAERDPSPASPSATVTPAPASQPPLPTPESPDAAASGKAASEAAAVPEVEEQADSPDTAPYDARADDVGPDTAPYNAATESSEKEADAADRSDAGAADNSEADNSKAVKGAAENDEGGKGEGGKGAAENDEIDNSEGGKGAAENDEIDNSEAVKGAAENDEGGKGEADRNTASMDTAGKSSAGKDTAGKGEGEAGKGTTDESRTDEAGAGEGTAGEEAATPAADAAAPSAGKEPALAVLTSLETAVRARPSSIAASSGTPRAAVKAPSPAPLTAATTRVPRAVTSDKDPWWANAYQPERRPGPATPAALPHGQYPPPARPVPQSPVSQSPVSQSPVSQSPVPQDLAPAGGSGTSGAGRKGSRKALLAVVALVVIVAVGAVVATVLSMHGSTKDPARTTPVAASGTVPALTANSPGLIIAINDTGGAVPASFAKSTFTPTQTGTTDGFTISYPGSWKVKQQSGTPQRVFIDAPDGVSNVEVDLTAHTKSNMVAEAQYLKSQTLAQGSFPGYKQVRLSAEDVRGTPGAIWAFYYTNSAGTMMKAEDILFILRTKNGPQSYAILATSPNKIWQSTMLPRVQDMLKTFQPNP